MVVWQPGAVMSLPGSRRSSWRRPTRRERRAFQIEIAGGGRRASRGRCGHGAGRQCARACQPICTGVAAAASSHAAGVPRVTVSRCAASACDADTPGGRGSQASSERHAARHVTAGVPGHVCTRGAAAARAHPAWRGAARRCAAPPAVCAPVLVAAACRARSQTTAACSSGASPLSAGGPARSAGLVWSGPARFGSVRFGSARFDSGRGQASAHRRPVRFGPPHHRQP